MSEARVRVAMPSEALDRLVEIVSRRLDFSWDEAQDGPWHDAWRAAQAEAGPARHNKALTRMAREMLEVDRGMEWFPPPGRVPPSCRLRRILKVIRFWLMEGVPDECFQSFLLIGLVDAEERWPEEVRRACEAWGPERAAAARYVWNLLYSPRPRTHAIHGEFPLPEPHMPDDLVYAAHAATCAVYLGIMPCTARFEAKSTVADRPSKWSLSAVVHALQNDKSLQELVAEMHKMGVMITPIESRSG